MPVKSTIFTALAVCLALSAAEAQARRIAPHAAILCLPRPVGG